MVSLPHSTQGSAAAGTADERGYYSILQAAALLGVSRVSIWRWIRNGQLPAARLGHRTTRIKREDVEHLLVQIGPAGSRSWVGKGQGSGTGAEYQADRGSAPRLEWRDMGPTEHFVQFYETDDVLLEAVGDFIATGLRAGEAGIVIATLVHREGIEERLRAFGLDVAALRASGLYVPLDATETLAHFMVDRTPNPIRFQQFVGSLIAQASEGGRRVRAFGEMVALLALEGSPDAAIRLEELWNDLQQTHSFALFCAYPMDRLVGEALAELLEGACATHSQVIPAESYTALPSEDERLRAITVLQQKASWLESEIATRRQAEEQLQVALVAERAAREEAEAALRLRDDFLSVAAHELKTPVTSLSGQAQLTLRRLARAGQLQPEQLAQTLETIKGQADKLGRLLNQLLDISRLEAGRLEPEWQPIDLAQLVEHTADEARAWTTRHTIAVEAPASLEVVADPLRLEQVLTNLLDNAIKYSPGGGAIEVVLARTARGEVELSVRDWGLGIPPEKRGQIFERFYQAHSNGHRSGMGLGLYICRHIVELHGGQIQAEFPPEGGTRVVVRLPDVAEERAPTEPCTWAAKGPAGAGAVAFSQASAL